MSCGRLSRATEALTTRFDAAHKRSNAVFVQPLSIYSIRPQAMGTPDSPKPPILCAGACYPCVNGVWSHGADAWEETPSHGRWALSSHRGLTRASLLAGLRGEGGDGFWPTT